MGISFLRVFLCLVLFATSGAFTPAWAQACLKSLLTELSQKKGKAVVPHPFQLTARDVSSGQQVFFARGPRDNGTVVRKGVGRDSQNKPIRGVFLKDASERIFFLPEKDFNNNAFSQPDFFSHPPFENGQWVAVKMDSPSLNQYGESVPYELATFQRMNKDGTYTVLTRKGLLTVERGHLFKTATGTAKAAEDLAATLPDTEYSFVPGEIATARSKANKVLPVRIIEKRGDKYLVATSDGKTHEVRGTSLSKNYGVRPAMTINGRFLTPYQVNQEELSAPLVAFFDGARKLTSHPQFQTLSPKDQLRVVSQYLNTFVKPHQIAYPFSGKETNTMICMGAAVCAHKAYLIANIMAEAGHEVRMNAHIDHSWTEVDIVGKNGKPERFVVDPGFNEVTEWDSIVKRAEKDPKSIAALYYTNPERATATLPRARNIRKAAK